MRDVESHPREAPLISLSMHRAASQKSRRDEHNAAQMPAEANTAGVALPRAGARFSSASSSSCPSPRRCSSASPTSTSTQSRTRRTCASSGSQQLHRAAQNPTFWLALKNTFYFALVGGPLTVAVSLGAALLLNAKLVRFKAFFRTIYFMPFVTTLVAVAIVWRYLYHPQYGLLNYALGAVGIDPIDWLGDPRWAMPAIILLAVWKNFGYNMLIFIAGLQAIPEDLYEAARARRRGAVRQFCTSRSRCSARRSSSSASSR